MNLDDMAATLEESGEYRVLRRLPARTTINEHDGSETRIGIAIDIETTGLDPKKDEIIELALMPFTFSPDGRIFEIQRAFQSLRQPSIPISAEITGITGITDDMVAGHTIDPNEIEDYIKSAAIIVAHHAGFDRPFAERFCPAFQEKCWACSMSEINWQVEGFESARLAWLLDQMGFFYQRHRSLSDCEALVALLANPLPKSGALALSVLLDAARQPTHRIWAAGAPFEAKDILKARGYHWSPGERDWPKSWYIDVKADAQDAEIAFLRQEIFRENDNFRIDKLTAYNRFSERAMP